MGIFKNLKDKIGFHLYMMSHKEEYDKKVSDAMKDLEQEDKKDYSQNPYHKKSQTEEVVEKEVKSDEPMPKIDTSSVENTANIFDNATPLDTPQAGPQGIAGIDDIDNSDDFDEELQKETAQNEDEQIKDKVQENQNNETEPVETEPKSEETKSVKPKVEPEIDITELANSLVQQASDVVSATNNANEKGQTDDTQSDTDNGTDTDEKAFKFAEQQPNIKVTDEYKKENEKKTTHKTTKPKATTKKIAEKKTTKATNKSNVQSFTVQHLKGHIEDEELKKFFNTISRKKIVYSGEDFKVSDLMTSKFPYKEPKTRQQINKLVDLGILNVKNGRPKLYSINFK